MKNSAALVIVVGLLVGSLLALPGGASAQSHGQTLAQSGAAGIAVSPTNIKRGTTLNLIVTSPSGFDLSDIGVERVAIAPADSISHLEVLHQQPGQISVGFSIDDSATPGMRTLIIFDANHLVAASAAFNVMDHFPSACPGHEQCCDVNESTGLCNQCSPHCSPPRGNTCTAGTRCCEPGPGCACTPVTEQCH